MKFKKIVVAGGDQMGSQIAYQVAYHGFQVTICDVNAAAIAATKRRLATWDQIYSQEMNATPAVIHDTNERLSFATDLETAVEDADLVIETVPEVLDVKNAFYAELAKVAPAKAIFVTNSAAFVPSKFAVLTGRPEKFLALHFTNQLWTNRLVEVMGHQGTAPMIYHKIVAFARQVGMVPIELHKEQPTYVLDTLLIPFVTAALTLWADQAADAETVDRAWMLATGAPVGPFGILDELGLQHVYELLLTAGSESGQGKLVDVAHKLKTEMVDQQRLGQETNQGFYRYPAPAYAATDFLTGHH